MTAGGVELKICGITDAAGRDAALASGADFLGFVFFSRSPRHLSVEAAADLVRGVPSGVGRVALVVDPDDAALDALTAAVPLDLLQLHGRETPARVAAVRARTGLPVMKAVGVATAADLPGIDAAAETADRLLIDAKPPKDARLPGGNGVAFDWNLIAGRRIARPWMLAGGLTAETVAEAVARTDAPGVDVSSGVESAPGVKDPGKIAAFAAALGAR